ncbi:hypothetical protein JAK44_20825 [Stenotrophomonas maltophilia]|uniref:hypothetical protein n=1 Tax=Stenotrophomonas TaxID=40323 RepID=UPI0021C779FB|nr:MULTISPECIES: hypothetical protein [Stenotrophomonas]MCU1003381.1 hypothetical protein [Stenotrophomonas maltophilia]
MNAPTAPHSRFALIFLVAAIAAALVSMHLLRAAWHLAQRARQQGRSAWTFGVPAALGIVASIVA